MEAAAIIVTIGLAYLFGTLNGAYYLLRLRGIDVRETGSGNAGATNAGRLLGKRVFLIVLLIDSMKGAAASIIPILLELPFYGTAACALAATIGHIFPVQLQFRGGKGIAVSLGSLLVMSYPAFFLLLGFFLPIWLCIRKFSISGLLAYVLTAVTLPFLSFPIAVQAGFAAITCFILLAHLENIGNSFRSQRKEW